MTGSAGSEPPWIRLLRGRVEHKKKQGRC
jgi:hypothetical protein